MLHLDRAVGLVQAVHADAGGLLKGVAHVGPQPRAADLAHGAVDAGGRAPVPTSQIHLGIQKVSDKEEIKCLARRMYSHRGVDSCLEARA